MKTLKVNTECIINRENPTPVKDQSIALNITAIDPKADFQNFVLGIENTIDDDMNDEAPGALADNIPTKLFVKKIIVDIPITEEQMQHLLDINENPYHLDSSDYDYTYMCKLVDSNDKEYLFGVYNMQNGYYGHYIYENGKAIKIL